MDATNTPSNTDAAAEHAANTDAAIWGALAKMGGLAPRTSPVATPLGRPETISETGARLAREDAAKKAAGQPVHQSGTRPVAQPQSQQSQEQTQDDQRCNERDAVVGQRHVFGLQNAGEAFAREQQHRGDGDEESGDQELPLAEVQRLGGGEGDAEAERDEGVDAAQRQPAEQCLKDVDHRCLLGA